MLRICSIHWKAEEAEEKVAKLRAAGYGVDYDEMNPNTLRDWRDNLRRPSSLTCRASSQGRDVAIALRGYKTTRHTPLIFVEGEPEKNRRRQSPSAGRRLHELGDGFAVHSKRPSPNLRPPPSFPRPISRVIRARRCPRNSALSRIYARAHRSPERFREDARRIARRRETEKTGRRGLL